MVMIQWKPNDIEIRNNIEKLTKLMLIIKDDLELIKKKLEVKEECCSSDSGESCSCH